MSDRIRRVTRAEIVSGEVTEQMIQRDIAYRLAERRRDEVINALRELIEHGKGEREWPRN